MKLIPCEVCGTEFENTSKFRPKQYCSDNTEFIDQLRTGACDNNFECESNVCVSDECISEGLVKQIINWFKNLLGTE